MEYTYQSPTMKEYRRMNRNSPTPEELIIWECLRKRRMLGYKFIRQYSIESYILDFYCPKLRLGIEIDGEYHKYKDQKLYDKHRDEVIESYDIKILRYENQMVRLNINKVLNHIKMTIYKLTKTN